MNFQKSVRFLTIIFVVSFTSKIFAISIVDDKNYTVTLSKPAKRVITLAPSLTEMVFTVGAADKLVATVKSSNYPEAANGIDRIGDYERFNIETLLSYKPDLVLAWSIGNNRQQVEKIKKFNIPVYQSEPHQIKDIANTLRHIGILLGKSKQANIAANNFEKRLLQIQRENKNKHKLRAFYQIWPDPIYTINGQTVISRLMQICGLDNVFSDAKISAPKITQESVIGKNPEIIIASGIANDLLVSEPEWLSSWKRWPDISAVKNGNLFFIHPDIVHRQSTRILDGAEKMCEQADIARNKLRNNITR